jgi:hypothetical protein
MNYTVVYYSAEQVRLHMMDGNYIMHTKSITLKQVIFIVATCNFVIT